jgi:deoxyribodipyrimidine photo-lyase
MKSCKEEIAVFWFRRDLRLHDNTALWHALSSGYRVLPVFIADRNIIGKLEKDDSRFQFIIETINKINNTLGKLNRSIRIITGTPAEAFKSLAEEYSIRSVYFNEDYEPYGIDRDREIKGLLRSEGIATYEFRDHLVMEISGIMKSNNTPYTVFTPYSKRWRESFSREFIEERPSASLIGNFLETGKSAAYTVEMFGFRASQVRVKDYDLSPEKIGKYHLTRNNPFEDGTTNLGPHLRFGTVSVREVIRRTPDMNPVFTGELIWREFFMQILYHFPHLVDKSFRPEYDKIEWLNNEEYFQRWCTGTTGYPLVDAGMRELSETGYMHNRVRMVVASFLTKHLLTDWRWGEAWFASKLLDYELSSNNGNWQWAAGSGCDAAPYFRIFNPETQQQKFDPDMRYIKKWVPEYGTHAYTQPVVEHKNARERALSRYKSGINN